ncbi:GH25 family lysozyme [Clostridium botulinum]|uniref:GH25 family lysozyme n=1 Tax=Clostridium botulinum TaxID=1491 RepID=UPI003EF3FE1C
MKGIDISMHNNNINFAQVKNEGINVVIIKATEGVEYVDPFLNQHYQGAKAQDLNIGFYHFMSEKTSPSQQAVDFWNAIKGKQFNVIPCLDIETNNMGRSQKQISDRCIEFLTKFKALSGYDCLIYTGGYFGRDNLDSRVKKCKGWIAHYGVNTPMQTGFAVVGHQYTETGRVNGVNGNVDMNNFYDGIFINSSPKPIQQKEENKKVENIICYLYGLNKNAAEYLGDFLSCSTIEAHRHYNYKDVTNVFAIGGDKEDYTSYLNTLITGSNEYNTFERTIGYILTKNNIKWNVTKYIITSEEKNAKNKLVIFNNHVDKRAAEYLAYKLNCPLKENRDIDVTKYDFIYLAGGGEVPKGNNIRNIKGQDRYLTAKEIIDFMKVL